MKKTLLLLAIFSSMMIFAQTCGFDQVQNRVEKEFPEAKINRQAAEARLLNMDVRSYVNSVGATSKNAMYTGTIYEIPVVVHVITSSDASNAGLSLTDAQISTWIDNCNKMYATTYGGNYSAEGAGALDGNVIPFKLVLAKRTPQCTASNGILRVDGSALPGYNQYGIKSASPNGTPEAQVKTLSPHWPEASYFNIYIVIGFDGNKSTTGLMGYCGFPTNPDASYDSFMKVTVVTNANDSTLAHEFGHGLGLHHVFNGANDSPGASPTAADCPANANCLTDNDLVCDTSPSASLLSVFPTPTNAQINPCTGANYDGVQNNIMNYTNLEKKFTAGQRDRGVAFFMGVRSNLTQSLGATDLGVNPGAGTLVANSCVPTSTQAPGNYSGGPKKVVLGTINNASETYNNYVDYSINNCLSKVVYTDIPETGSSQLSVTFAGFPQYIKAWIDYNNNGILETSEVIGVSPALVPVASSPYTITFTPPASAVKNTFLRMRVIASEADDVACQDVQYGQAEDYSVRINTTLGSTEIKEGSTGIVVYTKSENKLTLVNSTPIKDFGKYEIFSLSGRLIQKGNARQEIILKQTLPRGTYIIHYQNVSEKFMN